MNPGCPGSCGPAEVSEADDPSADQRSRGRRAGTAVRPDISRGLPGPQLENPGVENLTRWDGAKSRLQEWKQLLTWRGEAAVWASCIQTFLLLLCFALPCVPPPRRSGL